MSVDPHIDNNIISCSELEPREEYNKKLEKDFVESHPILVEIVTTCLHNNPQKRPSAEELLERLQPVKSDIEKAHGGNVGRMVDLANILNRKEIKQRTNKLKS